MTLDRGIIRRVQQVLRPLPTEKGGDVLILATASTPPALAVLSTGDVMLTDETVRVVIHRRSSAALRLGGAFTLLAPGGEQAYRLEVVQATVRKAGDVALLEGTLSDVRPTSEPPWSIVMRFEPLSDQDVVAHLEYWRSVRSWLGSGTSGDPPTLP